MTRGEEAFLGLDLGTTSVKALLVDAAGRTLGSGRVSLELVSREPLQAEQDAEGWWRGAVAAVRACLAAAPGARVAAVGLTGQKHALLPLDEHDRPLAPAVLWADGRATAECDEVRRVFPAVARRTGALPQPGLFVPKWLRYARTRADLAARTVRLCGAKDWLRLRLTGTFATDRTEASASQAYDFRSNTWSGTLLTLWDLRPELLPPVLRSTREAGRVHAAAAEETGLPEGIPVAAGAGDNEAAALACGVVGPGTVALILGTSGTVVAWNKVRAAAGGLSYARHVVPAGYAATGTVLSAGRALRWIRRAAFPSDFTTEQMIEAAGASDPTRAPLVFLPSLVGERSPVPDPFATGAFVGLRPGHGRGHLARAVLDGVSLALAEVLVLMRGAGVAVRDVRLTSGGARSALWRGTLAAAAGVPVRRVGEREGPALGAALLAAAMTRRHGTLAGLVARWVRPGEPEPPDPAEVRRLRELGARLGAVRNALRGVDMDVRGAPPGAR
jgi:xylulokinase